MITRWVTRDPHVWCVVNIPHVWLSGETSLVGGGEVHVTWSGSPTGVDRRFCPPTRFSPFSITTSRGFSITTFLPLFKEKNQLSTTFWKTVTRPIGDFLYDRGGHTDVSEYESIWILDWIQFYEEPWITTTEKTIIEYTCSIKIKINYFHSNCQTIFHVPTTVIYPDCRWFVYHHLSWFQTSSWTLSTHFSWPISVLHLTVKLPPLKTNGKTSTGAGWWKFYRYESSTGGHKNSVWGTHTETQGSSGFFIFIFTFSDFEIHEMKKHDQHQTTCCQSDRLNGDFIRLFFLYSHREVSVMVFDLSCRTFIPRHPRMTNDSRIFTSTLRILFHNSWK